MTDYTQRLRIRWSSIHRAHGIDHQNEDHDEYGRRRKSPEQLQSRVAMDLHRFSRIAWARPEAQERHNEPGYDHGEQDPGDGQLQVEQIGNGQTLSRDGVEALQG